MDPRDYIYDTRGRRNHGAEAYHRQRQIEAHRTQRDYWRRWRQLRARLRQYIRRGSIRISGRRGTWRNPRRDSYGYRLYARRPEGIIARGNRQNRINERANLERIIASGYNFYLPEGPGSSV